MDNLTHTLTGLVLSRAGLNRYYARPALVLMLAANAPDIDVVSMLGGTIRYLQYHRGYAHSIAMLPIIAALPMLAACAARRSMQGWKAAYLLSMIGVASHFLLDWTNTYGVRMLLPFSAQWLHLDITNIVDLWIWGVLVVASVGPMLGRLVSSEIGAKPGTGRGLAIFALCFLVTYEFGRYLVHDRALAVLNSRIYQGAAPIRTAAFPASAANPMLWIGWVQGGTFTTRYSLNLMSEFDPGAGTTFYPPEQTAAIDAAKQTFAFQKFLDFSQYPLWRVTPVADPEGGNLVQVRDWRFAFAAEAIVDRDNHVVRTWAHF